MKQLIDDARESLSRLDSFASVLDVMIIAVLIFALLMALRGTTAMTLLRGGIAVVLALFLLGRILDLSVINFLVRNSLTGLVVGVVVIFQPEIRRALERAGRTSIRNLLSRSPQSEALDEIVSAIMELARARHGAIIVLERGTGLEDVIETGVRIDAGLNSKLVEGVFFPNSPLHDKAVIVRNDRMVAAGCTLPLSSGGGSARLGTRHRAAVGISEQTDAIAVVVSEELGSISIAADGRLIQLRDENRVRSSLEALTKGHANGLRNEPAPQAT